MKAKMAARQATKQRPNGAHRRCLVSGAILPKDSLLRFVVTVEGSVKPDAAGNGGGRGLWLSPGRDMIKMALARKLFAKAARRWLGDVDDALTCRAEADLIRCWRAVLGLARRAGQVATDGAEVAAWTTSGKAGLLIETGNVDERAGTGVARVRLADPDDLGRPVGQPDCERAAVAVGPFAERLVREAGRLAGFGCATMVSVTTVR
jgi:predicted RNA-binding protein YlxR (DUF448 family)